MGQLPNCNFTDFEKQIVYIGVIDPAEFRSVFGQGLLLHCDFSIFVENLKKSEKLLGDSHITVYADMHTSASTIKTQ